MSTLSRFLIPASALVCFGSVFALSGCEQRPSVQAEPPATPATDESTSLLLVRDGNPQGVVVCSAPADSPQRLAVEEFVRVVKRSTGARLPVVSDQEEATLPKETIRLFVGDSPQAKAAGLEEANLPAESFRILTRGNALFLVGKDETSPESGTLPASRPTLWALNRLLEEGLGVRWLWPGELGTYIPQHKDFSLAPEYVTYQPTLLLRSLRLNISDRRRLASADRTVDARLKEEALLWAENHQAGRRGDIQLGHAFADWWAKYSGTHPDYFAEGPPGARLPYPTAERAKLRLANPQVIEQIAENYDAAGRPEFWNVCPNDGTGFDISAETQAWDLPAGQSEADIFSGRANLTARYVEFWNRLYQRLAKINPEVKLATYAYSAYHQPPPAERPLTAQAVVGIVDTYNAYDNWKGWADSGASLILRPNWWHQGGDAPYLPLAKTARYLKFAWDHGMVGLDMDSVIGYWATQGPNYYLAARMMTNSSLTLDEILSEYASAFGGGADKIREYLDYWQKISDQYNYPQNATSDSPENLRGRYEDLVREGKIGTSILNGSKYALPYLYGDEVLAPAERLLDEATAAIDSKDQEAHQRVDFLRHGLQELRATRNQIALGAKLRAETDPELMTTFTDGAAQLDELREKLSLDHSIWGAAVTRHEDRYKVLIRPENLKHHNINLDGM